MRIISTKIHAISDYLLALVLFLSPRLYYLMDLAESAGASVWMVPSLVGLVQFCISFVTRYEGGVFGKIPMTVHLNLDLVLGFFLAASPWLFGFNEIIYKPHLFLGLALILLGLLTKKVPAGRPGFRERRPFYREDVKYRE